MSEPSPPVACPFCRVPLRGELPFCPQCGLEVRPACPVCGEHRRPLATLDPLAEAWCEGCDALLYACEACGRWLTPDVRTCPNPQCRGTVVPHFPQHTGRRWDNSGATVGWRWPAEWDRTHPRFAPPRIEEWSAHEEVHAAAVAHGVVYAWMGASLVSPDRGGVWQSLEGPRTPAPPAGQLWRCPLGQATAPCPHVRYFDRLVISGGCAVLATERGYLLAGLRHRSDAALYSPGSPMGQVAGPHAWVGWCRLPEGPQGETLLTARVGSTGDPQPPEKVRLLPGSSMQTGSRMAMNSDEAFWPAVDGRVWRLDLSSRLATPATATGNGTATPWVSQEGLRVVREALGRLTVEFPAPDGRGPGRSVPGGTGPYRGAFVIEGQLLIAGEQVVLLDPRTGEKRSEAKRPPGRWVDAAVAPAPDGEPRLLVLTMENDFAVLSALKVSSGGVDQLWRGYRVQARALLPVGRLLHVVHDQGIVRLSR